MRSFPGDAPKNKQAQFGTRMAWRIFVLWLRVGVLAVFFWCDAALAQQVPFEGWIDYRHFIEIKDSLVNEWQLISSYGSGSRFFLKAGNYRLEPKGSLVQWQVYRADEARIYTKLYGIDTVYYRAADVPNEQLLELYPVKQDRDHLLGYTCHLLMMKVKGQEEASEVMGKMYYFAPELRVKPEWFERHLINLQDVFFAHARALPLRIVLLQRHYRLIMEASQVKHQTLDAALFVVPDNLPLKEGL